MDSDKLIRLLIVDKGLHQAEKITSALRGYGLHVLAEHAEDTGNMCDIIVHKSVDIMLFSLDLPDLSLQQIQSLIRECGRHISILGITQNISEEVMVEAMKLGAQDVVNINYLHQMALTVKRESDNLKIWRKAINIEKELHESEQRCQSLLVNSKDAVAYVHEGMHIYANEAYLELFGNTEFDELEGMPLIDMVDSSQQDTLKRFLRDLSQHKNSSNELELKLVNESGEVFEGLLEFSRASYDGETCTQILIRAQVDTSELEQQIDFLHQHDLVTNLLNRQYFMENLQQTIDEAISGQKESNLFYISIDNFEQVRSSIGISGCDILINDIAKTLKQNALEDDLVARFGAYSYSILLADRDQSKVEAFAELLLKQIEQQISEVGKQSISATCSIAIYHIDENAPDNANEIVARTERTLDKIQVKGGNQYLQYVPVSGEMTQAEEDALMAKSIKSAIANNTIDALYQPIVSINGITGERYEILRSLFAEDRTEIAKNEYMPVAERTGLAKALDRWAIVNAIKTIATSAKAGRKLDVFIPLSCDAITDASLAGWVSDRIKNAKIPSERLVFMLDEAHVVNQLKAAKNLFQGLKEIHCQIVLDNFGTGLNPFQLVKHIQPDFIRINTEYMEGLSSSPDNQNSIRELTTQASSMEISSIIPKVVDASILSVLWTVGADFVQGDFLQAPAASLEYDFSSM